MKRIVSLILCLLLTVGMSAGAFASTDFGAVIFADKESAAIGDVVTLIVSLSNTEASKSASIDVSIGESLELVSGEMLSNGALIKDFTVSKAKGVVAFGSSVLLDGEFAKISVKVLEGSSRTVGVTVKLNPSGAEQYTEFTIKKPEASPVTAAVGFVDAEPGETVSLNVALSEVTAVKSIAVSDIEYDGSALELVGGEWAVEDAVISNWNAALEKGVAALNTETNVDGTVFVLTVKVKNGTKDGVYPVSLKITAKDAESETIQIDNAAGGVNVKSNNVIGDTDGDGVVTSVDVVILKRIISGLVIASEKQMKACDFDGDDYISAYDLVQLKKLMAS